MDQGDSVRLEARGVHTTASSAIAESLTDTDGIVIGGMAS